MHDSLRTLSALALAVSLSVAGGSGWLRLKRTLRRGNHGRSRARSASTIRAQLQRGFKITGKSVRPVTASNCCRSATSRIRADRASLSRKLPQLQAGFQVTDGPNDQGQMFERPGAMADIFPRHSRMTTLRVPRSGGKLPPECRCSPRRAGTMGFPLVRPRRVPDVSRGRSRLHPRHFERLRESARGFPYRPAANITDTSPAVLSACQSR